ncbi:MAG: DUF2807 domain-containing protein [Saprospiraceae bacterium]
MKKLCCLCLAICLFTQLKAQVYGNGKIITQTRAIENLSEVLINVNGKVKIICGAPTAKIEITYDENIIDLLTTERNGAVLELAQKKWIEGTQKVQINIYTQTLDLLNNDSWSTVTVENINQEKLIVQSSISTVKLKGKVAELIVQSKNSTIKAFELTAKTVLATVSGDGKIYVNASEELEANRLSEDGKISYQGTPSKITGNAKSTTTASTATPIDTRFIDLKLKNNSLSNIRAYVKGPKPNGKYFSYGLNFFPLTSKKERWSIGTKLYRVHKSGQKVLLHEVKAEDEGTTVKLRKKSK